MLTRLHQGAFIIFLFTILSFIPSPGFSEGTKQIRPLSTEFGALSVTGNGVRSFATYSAAANYRLYIHVANYNEVILFGLQRNGNQNRTYQLKDPNGLTVLTALCPSTIADSGYIADYDAACVGPFFSSGGYHPLKYPVPAGSPLGDYYIQFNGSIDFELFDFQVVNGSHPIAIPADAIDGRVYSQAWQFYAKLATGPPNPTAADPFSAKVYVRSDDSIVTSCKFKDMNVGECSIFCNQYGCLNSGNPYTDRQSSNDPVSSAFPAIAKYKVFLNNPDPLVYPDGFYGEMVDQPEFPKIENDPSYPLCSGRKIITIHVNKSGNVNVVITVPYGSPATDVTLTATVQPLANFIYWDGKDGTGTLVPDGTPVNIDITYLNGLTNLPLWDIEKNPKGFEITLIRPLNPAGQTPKSYWDDTQLTVVTGGNSPCETPPNGTNFTGCTPSGILPVPGCHPWETTGSDCHNKMINTWWYSASTSHSSLGIVQIVTPPAPTVIGNFDRCGPGVVNLIALVLSDEIVRWYDQASGGTLLGTSNSGAPFSQTLATGNYTFYAEAYNPTPPYFCTSATRTPVVVHVIPIPAAPVALNPPFFHCGSGNVNLSVIPVSNINIEWYDAPIGGNLVGLGNSFFTPAIGTTTDYYAQAVDVSNPTHCTSATRTLVTAEIRPVPSVSYTATAEGICSGLSPTIILGSNPSGASLTWFASNPDGNVNGYTVFGTGDLTAEVLNINTGMFQSGAVNYAVTPVLASCTGNVTYIDITVKPYPDISFTPATSIPVCSGTPTNIGLSSLVANTLYSWTASGYSPDITPGPSVSGNTSPIVQTFSNGGHTVETVIFQVIPTAAGCTSPASSYSISVNPVPAVVLPNPAEQTACSNTASVPVSLGTDVVGIPVDYSWTTVCDPGLTNCPPPGGSSAPASLPAATVINPTASQQNVVFSVTAGIGTCTGPASAYIVKINPVPLVQLPTSTPPNSQIICSGQQTLAVPLSSQVTSQTVDFSWTVSCETNIPLCPSSGSGTSLPPVAISNTDTIPKYATYTVVPYVEGCQGISSTYQVQVNPSPTVNNATMSEEICSGTTSAAVVLHANVSPTTFTWTATASSGLITGFIPGPMTGNIPAQTLFNSSNLQGTVTYHILPSSQNGMPCPGAPADYIILVNPIPQPSISGSPQVCYDQSGTNYYSTNHPNHDYQWTVTGAVSVSGNGNSSIMVDWGPGPSGSLRLTETDQSYTQYCSFTTPDYPVIINPAPAPNITTNNASPCGNTTVNYTVGPSQVNHAYQWTIVGGNPTAGTNSGIDVTWGNINPCTVKITESVTYAPGVVCSKIAFKTITLNLIPDDAGLISGTHEVCQSPALQYSFDVGPINNSDSYTWTYVPAAGVNITNNGTTAILSFSSGSVSGDLYVRGNKTGCASGLQSPAHHITVHALPVVSLTSCFDPVTNINAAPFLLKGGTPLGASGIYYIDGASITGLSLSPSTLSIGSHTLSYTYTDANTCFASDSKTFTVLGANPPCGTTMTDHRDNPPSVYKTAFLGGRCWMTENLHYGTKITTPSQIQPQHQTDNCVSEKYCLTSDDAVCSKYGGLYQWDEIIQYGQTQVPYQGLCPPAWHVPTSAEWQNLIDASQGEGIAGGILQNGSFKALSMGFYYLNNLWSFMATDNLSATMFWTSTLAGSKPVARGINIINPSVSLYESSKANAFPVRCVRD